MSCSDHWFNDEMKFKKHQSPKTKAEKNYLLLIADICHVCDGEGEVRECDAAGDMDDVDCYACDRKGYTKKEISIPINKHCAQEIINIIAKYEKNEF